jgi:hypothetical protein
MRQFSNEQTQRDRCQTLVADFQRRVDEFHRIADAKLDGMKGLRGGIFVQLTAHAESIAALDRRVGALTKSQEEGLHNLGRRFEQQKSDAQSQKDWSKWVRESLKDIEERLANVEEQQLCQEDRRGRRYASNQRHFS